MSSERMEHELNSDTDIPFNVRAKDYANRTIQILVGSILIMLVIGFIIEHSFNTEYTSSIGQFILNSWALVKFAASFGGHFWAAAFVCSIGGSVLGWASALLSNADKIHNGKRLLLFSVCALSCIIYTCSYAALIDCYQPSMATAYQNVTIGVLFTPVLLFGLLLIFAMTEM